MNFARHLEFIHSKRELRGLYKDVERKKCRSAILAQYSLDEIYPRKMYSWSMPFTPASWEQKVHMKIKTGILLQSIVLLLMVGCGTNKALESSAGVPEDLPLPNVPSPYPSPLVYATPSPTPLVVLPLPSPSPLASSAPVVLRASISITLPQNIPFLNVPIGGFSEICVQVSNNGAGTASQISQSIGSPFSVSNTAVSNCPFLGCTSTLGAGHNCSLTVRYTPTQAVQSNQVLVVSYFDALLSQSPYQSISGTAVTPGSLSLSKKSGNFQSVRVGTNGYGCVQASNTGGGTVQYNSLAIAAPFFLDSTGLQTCGGQNVCSGSGTLSGGASCVVGVRYTPVALDFITRTFSANYTNGMTGSSVLLDLSGNGNYPNIAGTYSDQAGDTVVVQQDSNNGLTYWVTKPNGHAEDPVSGAFNSVNQIRGWTYTGNLVSPMEIDWSQGSVWSKH